MRKTTGLRFGLTVMVALLMLGVGSLYAQTADPTQPVMPMGPMHNGTGPGMVMDPATHMGSTIVQPTANLMLNAHQVPGATNPGAQTSPGLQMAPRGNMGPGIGMIGSGAPATPNPNATGPGAMRTGPVGPMGPGMTFNQTTPPTGSGTTNPLMGPAMRGPMGPLSPGNLGPTGPRLRR